MGPLSLNPALSTEAASHQHPSGNARRDLSTNNNNRPTTGCKSMLSEPETHGATPQLNRNNSYLQACQQNKTQSTFPTDARKIGQRFTVQ